MFFYVFHCQNQRKRSWVDAKTLFLIGVWHINQKRRAWLRWVYNLLGGGLTVRVTFGGVVMVLCLYLFKQSLNLVLGHQLKLVVLLLLTSFLIRRAPHRVWLCKAADICHGQHIKALKHFVYVKYGCLKQFEVAVSLNHDIITSCRLYKLPRTPKYEPSRVGVTV